MCGIAGFQGGFEPELLDRMSRTVAHRGPDGDGTALLPGHAPRGTVGLAHRRLAIIDLSHEGRQPMTACCARCGSSTDKDLVLTYNGEIYNFQPLRAELQSKGHVFHSGTDSEVLLHLYAEQGPSMVSRLNGIFAFAIFDGRETGRPEGVQKGDLFVARDPLGVKPLYYAEPPDGFLFGSELKALLKHRGLSRELDFQALHYNLAYLWTPAPHTMLRDVRKLRPGYALLVRGGRVAREWSYYDLPYGREPMRESEEEIAAELRAQLRSAVDRQMVADVPVGAFLSGGLDSSAVVAMMKRARPGDRPICYSIGFAGNESVDGSPADLPFARQVAEHLDVQLQVLEVQPDMIRQLERMLYFLDEPQADPAPINALLIAEQARRDGITVLLSGAGGDDIFSGYRRHRALRMERLWAWLPLGARIAVASSARRVAAGQCVKDMHAPWARRTVKAFSHADMNADARTAAYFWWSGESMRRALYSSDLSSRLESTETAAPLLASLARIAAERDPLNRMLYLEGKHFLADHNLNYTDKMGMAAGVEVRVPLLDLELVDFATRIPSSMKQKGSVGKYIFKKAMEPDLPREVIYRAKSGFGAPLRRWLREELREQVAETLSPTSLASRGLFDPGAVQKLVELDRSGRVDGSYTIFALMCTELWCRMFIDSDFV
jgi:asparagine synthase (glutamine-hydrolysing)